MTESVTSVELQPADNAAKTAIEAFIASVKEAVEAFIAKLVEIINHAFGIEAL